MARKILLIFLDIAHYENAFNVYRSNFVLTGRRQCGLGGLNFLSVGMRMLLRRDVNKFA